MYIKKEFLYTFIIVNKFSVHRYCAGLQRDSSYAIQWEREKRLTVIEYAWNVNFSMCSSISYSPFTLETFQKNSNSQQ